VKNKSNVTHHMLNTRIRQLPGSGRVVTTGYPDLVPGQICYPSHLYYSLIELSTVNCYIVTNTRCTARKSWWQNWFVNCVVT